MAYHSKPGDRLDITGQKFGEWKVIREVNDSRPGRHFECLCLSCNTLHSVHGLSLRQGRSTRCVSCARKKDSYALSMVGKKFGEWTVISCSGKKHRSYAFLCRCKCGKEEVKHGPALRYGKGLMCVCCNNKRMAEENIKHGMAKTKIYKVWSAIKSRCECKTSKAFKWYGGRGIYLCDHWQEFENFYADMGDPPPGMEIDRIDNDGPYSPENCRWISHVENSHNSRTFKLYHTETYKKWNHQKACCQNPKYSGFEKFGAFGIKMCNRWYIFENFLQDMGECPEGYDLARLDSAKDFCKENCIWVKTT